MLRIFYIFIALFVFTNKAFCFSSSIHFDEEKLEEISQNYIWKSLLHYEGNESIISDLSFFISKNGRENPKDELIETLNGFLENNSLSNDHLICKYPARFDFILKQFNLKRSNFPSPNCTNLKTHLEKISPQKMFLVFASENLKSPMSMMGHLFLKVSGIKDGRELEHALSYTASKSNDSAFSFYLKSLFSGSKGYYFLSPFYKKLIQYNDGEQRNIWEYELTLPAEKVDFFVKHMWEIKEKNVPYNFFLHHCGIASIYMLSSAEEKITNLHKKPFMSPADIIKSFNELGLISHISIHPSESHKIRALSSNFNSNELKIVKKIVKEKDFSEIENLDSKKQAEILTMADYFSGQRFLTDKISEAQYKNLNQKIGNKLSSLESAEWKYHLKNPLNVTPSSRLSLGAGTREETDFITLSFQPVYNDIIGRTVTDFNEFQLSLFNIEGEFETETNRFNLKRLDFFNMKSIVQHHPLIGGRSGGFQLSLNRDAPDNDLNLVLDASLGKALKIGELMFYGLGHIGVREKIYFSPEIGFFWTPTKWTKTTASLSHFLGDFDSYSHLKISQGFFLGKNNAIHLLYKSFLEDDFHEFEVKYSFYF